MKQAMQVLTSSESNEWYTPPEIIFLVKQVFREIDLDPASSELANQVVGAKEFYSEKGLELGWRNRVFVNPPYGRAGLQGKFLEKALKEYIDGNVREVIVLTKTVPGYIWYDDMFHSIWFGSVCITRDRLSFYKPEWVVDGKINYPKNSKSKTASTFWYLGDNIELFSKVFSTIGTVIDFSFETVFRHNREIVY